jgi:hypothetical protein
MAELDPTLQNGRVTMAVLGTKLDGVKEDIREIKDNLETVRKDHEERIRCIEGYRPLWRGVQWAAMVMGVSVMALLWLLMTGQVTIVKVAETLVK